MNEPTKERLDNPMHTYPRNDIKEHVTNDGINCWCRPEYRDGVILHNSLDRREVYEQKKH